MFEQIIKNYYKTLNLHKLGITSQSSVQDVARACVEKAFIDSIVNSAGRIWGITHYTDEVEEVKTLVSSEVCRYLNSDPNTYTHNQLHSYLIHTITENCFKKYNSDIFQFQKHKEALLRKDLTSFEINTTLASIIENEFNAAFFDRKIKLNIGNSKNPNWVRKGISPFKMFLSSYFRNLKMN